MGATGFGRKGIVTGEPAPTHRRASLVAAPATYDKVASGGDAEARREVFLARERASRATADETVPMEAAEAALRALKVEAEPLRPPTDRALKFAWPIWFLLGLVGGHRFYLRRPLTGALQAALFIGCIAAVSAGHFEAFSGLALSWLCYLIDGIRLRRLFLTAGRP